MDAGDRERTTCSRFAMTAATELKARRAVPRDAVRQDGAQRTEQLRPDSEPARFHRATVRLPAMGLIPRLALRTLARYDDEWARPAPQHLHRRQRSSPAHRRPVPLSARRRQHDGDDVSWKIQRPAREQAPVALPQRFHDGGAQERRQEQLPELFSRVPTAL